MSEKPWLTDPKYGGMSETAARRSYEAWQAQGQRTLPARGTVLPETDAEIGVRKRSIERQLEEYAEAMTNAEAWWDEWAATRPKGFRARRRRKPAGEVAA